MTVSGFIMPCAGVSDHLAPQYMAAHPPNTVPRLFHRAAKDKDTSPAAMGGGSGTLTEVANNTAFRRACADKSGLCVVVVLDPASADFERHLGEARTLAGLRAKQPVHFIWVDATSQPSFAEQFGLQPSDAPAAVALAPKKLRFRVLPGAFSASSLDKLVDAVLLGKERTQGMQVSLLWSVRGCRSAVRVTALVVIRRERCSLIYQCCIIILNGVVACRNFPSSWTAARGENRTFWRRLRKLI